MSDTFHPIGPDYCVEHHGIREEDAHWCDFRSDDFDEQRCLTCNGSGVVKAEGEEGWCPNCEEGITLCDLRPLGYLTIGEATP